MYQKRIGSQITHLPFAMELCESFLYGSDVDLISNQILDTTIKPDDTIRMFKDKLQNGSEHWKLNYIELQNHLVRFWVDILRKLPQLKSIKGFYNFQKVKNGLLKLSKEELECIVDNVLEYFGRKSPVYVYATNLV